MEPSIEPTLKPVNEKRTLLGNIALVLMKTIAYLVIVFISMMGGMALVSTMVPNMSLAALATAVDFYDWKSLNFQYLGQVIGVVLSTLVLWKVVEDKNYQSVGLGFKQSGKGTLLGILWAVGILSVSFLIVWLSGGLQVVDTDTLGVALLGYLSFFLLVAILEEIICRGYLLQMISHHLNYKVGILCSSVIFAVFHLGNDHVTWIAVCNLILGGVFMALLYFKYQNLYAPIGFHWIWNYFQGNILGFGVSGTDVLGVLQITTEGPNWLSGGDFGLEGSIVTCLLQLAAILYLWYHLYEQLERGEWKKELEPAIAVNE